MATSVIGLDIGTTRVRAVEVQHQRGGVQVLRYAEAPLPLGAVQDGEVSDPQSVVHALRSMWADAKFSHREVIIGVGNQRVLVRRIQVPWMPLAQIRTSLPYQVQDTLPVAVEDALLDFYPTAELTGQDGRMVDGLLVAATRDTIQANVSAVESAGLHPMMVDLNAFALLRAHRGTELANRTVALVDIGARITNVVVAHNGVPQLVRTLASGGQHITDAIASELRITMPDAENVKRRLGVGLAAPPDLDVAVEVIRHVTQGLVEAIRNTLVYYSSNNPGAAADMIVLTGGGSYLAGLGQYLSSASRLSVSMGDLLGGLSVAKSARLDGLRGVESTFAVPLGLAMGVAA